MCTSQQSSVDSISQESTRSNEEDTEIETFSLLLAAVISNNLEYVEAVFEERNVDLKRVVKKEDKNNKNSTLLHVAIQKINKNTNLDNSLCIIKLLIQNGAQIDVMNDIGETPFMLLDKISKKLTNFNWDPVKSIFQSARKRQSNEDGTGVFKRQRNHDSPEPSVSTTASEMYRASSAPKKTLHGLTYQLRLLTLFIQRVPEAQPFFLATEMDEAGHFDDIVLKYKKNGEWCFRFIQAKHKNNSQDKIRKIDIFNKKLKVTKNEKPFLLYTYYESFCKIKENKFFAGAHLEEFLICTNIGFADDALPYFKCTVGEIEQDAILYAKNVESRGTKPVKYKLKKEKFEELKKTFEVNSQKEDLLRSFFKKFRFLANYVDNELNYNIRYELRNCLNIENTDLAYAYLQKRVLKWFESYKSNTSNYLLIKDKNSFLQSLNSNIQSLLVAGYSSYFSEELKLYGIRFKNTLSLRYFLRRGKKVPLLTIATLSPKLTLIKLSQMLSQLECKQDQVIFVSADKFLHEKKIVSTFTSESSFQLLVIEYKSGIKIDKNLLSSIFKADKQKKVILIGQKNDVVGFNECLCFYDIRNAFDDLTTASQEKILKKHVIFQGMKMNLNELVDVHAAKKVIDTQSLEALLQDNIEIGDNSALVSDSFNEEFYIPRILAQCEVKPEIFQNEVLLEACLFLIGGTNEDYLMQLGVRNTWINMWEPNTTLDHGIVLPGKMDTSSIFNQLCRNNVSNVCWLEYEQDKMILKNIKNITNVLYKHDVCFSEQDLSHIKILEKKICIVSNGPGCGKSVFMTKVAHQLKKIMTHIWVLRIDLTSYVYIRKKRMNRQNYMKSLDDIHFMEHDVEAAIHFLADILISQNVKNQNKHFTRQLFIKSLQFSNKHFMKYPQIILIFDGFDEISPKFKSNTLILLKALKNSNVAQMWITTRIHEEFNLVSVLDSPSLFLNPLQNDEKANYLHNFWKYSLKNIEDIQFEAYTESIITYLTEMKRNFPYNYNSFDNIDDIPKQPLNTSNYFNSSDLIEGEDFLGIAKDVISYFGYFNNHKLSDFIDNPLHLQMLAEIIFQNKFNNVEKIQLHSLYEQFINIKWTICCEDKNAIGNSLIGLDIMEDHLKYLKTKYQQIAFQILFPQYEEIEEIDDKVKLARPGLLVIHEDNVLFVHRSFAEYFVSDYFANNLQNETIQQLVLSEILLNENYQLIRTFLEKNNEFLEKLGNKTQVMINTINSRKFDLKFLYQMVMEETYNLLIKYLQDLPSGIFKNDIMFNAESREKKILIRVCSLSLLENGETLTDVLQALQHSVPSELFAELLTTRDENFENTVLHFAVLHRHNSTVKVILDFVKRNSNPQLFHKLLVTTNNIGMTALHITCSVRIGKEDYEESLNYLLNLAKDNNDALKECLLTTDNKGHTALHYTVQNFDNSSMLKVLLDFIKRNCDRETLSELLSKADKNGCTLLHLVCANKFEENLTTLLDIIKDDTEILNKVLLNTDDEGQTALHYTICYHDTPYMLEALLNFVKKNCTLKIFNDLLLKVDNTGYSVLHVACMNIEEKNGHDDILISLLNNAKYCNEGLTELLLKKTTAGSTALHYIICQFDDLSMLLAILDFITKNCTSEIVNSFLLQTNNKGYNLLHLTCEDRLKHLTYLLNAIKNRDEVMNKLLLQPDNDGEPVLHYSVLNFDALKVLLNFVTINFSPEKIKTLLFTVDEKKRTILHIACMRNSREEKAVVKTLSYLLNTVKNNSSEFDDLLLKIDNNGHTVLHYILNCFDIPSILTVLIDFVVENCTLEVLNKLLLNVDNDGRTGLHIFCERGHNEEILINLLNFVKANAAPKTLQEFLIKKDSNNNTALDYASCNLDGSSIKSTLLSFCKLHCDESFNYKTN